MKIFSIFANRLFTFHYKGEKMNELRRLLTNWNDPFYLSKFVKENRTDLPKNMSIQQVVHQIIENANDIDESLNELSNDPDRKLEEFFKPLYNQEYRLIVLSKQKGRKNFLRLYAIKIDDNCFVITGGAIKFHHLNKDRLHTQKEMQKIDNCRDFLKENGVFDSDSFYEFINEQQ